MILIAKPIGAPLLKMSNDRRNSSRRSREKSTKGNKNDNSYSRDQSPDYCGHKLGKKRQNTTRVCLVNINGIGMKRQSKKSEEIRNFMDGGSVDVMGLVETNVNWSKLRARDTLWDRTKTWFEHRAISVAYNTKDGVSASKRQQGGTATLLKDKIAHKLQDTGFDPSGLGRWSWVRIRGRQGCVTRMVTVYCPVKTGKGNTIYTQQLRVLQEDPTKRFWVDLGKQIMQWRANGEQLLISGDWNENVTGINVKEWMSLFTLKEMVTSLHEGTPPPTYNRGRDPIDGIFGTDNLSPSASGYLAFDQIPGDHRGIWVDIPNNQILGYKMHDIPRHKARRLKLDDPRVVKKYLRLLHSFFQTHDLYNKVRRLENRGKDNSIYNTTLQTEYNALDKIREEGMHYAERRCRKLHMGGVPWSPTLKKAKDRILFWTLVDRRRRRCHISVRRILRLKKRLKIEGETTMSPQQIADQIDQAYKAYKNLKKRALDERLNFQEALAQAKADKDNGDAVKILREMQHRESIRRTYRQIGSTLRPSKGSTTKIHVRTKQGFKEVTQMLTMERYIMKENEEKFHQTEGWSPLLEGQIAKDLGLYGEGPRVQDVLDGTYNVPEGYHPSVQRWIDTLKMDKTQHRQTRVTLEDYQQGWKLAKEKTASGALHFGHFKSCSNVPKRGWVHYTMSMIPMHRGFTPARWLQGTDVMILKAPNVFFLDKLRTIVLYEADFNHENRRMGKIAMDQALEQNQIAPEQFSRPGRSSQDNALGKRLVFDHFRFIKAPFGICSCNLKSCYDRVVHSAASLALQRVGVPPLALQCMFGTIQNLIHKVRTAYGTSQLTFGGKSTYLCHPQGLGQGNGAGPTIWSILSSTVFASLHAQGFSTAFCSALSMGLMNLCGFSYVDDSDLIADGLTVSQVYEKLQSILTEWDNLMQVNGAAIAPDKCWWYLVDFEWNDGKWKYVSPYNHLDLKVRDKTGTLQSLQRLPHHESKEMVGVVLALDGNHNGEVKKLRRKTSEWASKITRSPIDRDETWVALKHTISKTVEYPLAATTLTPKQLTYVMAPALTAGLPRSNISRSFPRDVLYGPVSLQGLGLTDPYIYQFCRHVQDIITQPWRNTEVGKLLQINLEAAKLEAGVYGSLFDCPLVITWMNTTHSLVLETMSFCQQFNICFDEPVPSLTPNCEGDIAIMEAISKLTLTANQLLRINNCRLYCRVVSLSDITDGAGKHLLTSHMLKPVQWPSLYKYAWPRQGKPTQSDWDLWLNALQSCFAYTGRALHSPLGNWNRIYLSRSPHWEWYVTPTHLYQRCIEDWIRYDGMTQRKGRYKHFYKNGYQWTALPDHATRTRIRHIATSIMSTGTRGSETIPNTLPPSGTLYDTFKEFPDASWICSWMSNPLCLSKLVDHLYKGDGLGISDGSYKKTWGLCSAGWIVWTPIEEIKGGGTIPGPLHSSSSYRGELGGLLGLVIILRILERLYPPTTQYTIKIGCDGLSALTRAMLTTREYTNTSHKDFDLISRIISYREGLVAKLYPIHVKGHQVFKDKPLTRAAILNHRMDTLAKEINTYSLINDSPVPDAPPISSYGITQVDHKDEPIVSALTQTLVQRVSGDRLKAYWKKKGRYKESFLDTWIDWTVMSRMMNEASHRRRIFISKWVSDQAAVGTIMTKRSERLNDTCPCCKQLPETRIHLLRCRASKTVWKRARKPLKKWLRKQDTDPQIQEALLDILRSFQKREKFDSYVPNGFPDPIQRCLYAQSHIGITNFLEGMLTYDWADVQQQYYTSIQSRKTGQRWAVGLSSQLWNLIYFMWDHRNHILHKNQEIDSLSGFGVVKAAIILELQRGLSTLDPLYYSYFTYSSQDIANMKSADARNWLVLIRRAREAKGFIYHDKISQSKPLKKWIGLTIPKKAATTYLRLARTGYNN